MKNYWYNIIYLLLLLIIISIFYWMNIIDWLKKMIIKRIRIYD